MQNVVLPYSLARAKAGSNRAVNRVMMEITTRSSMRVKTHFDGFPDGKCFCLIFDPLLFALCLAHQFPQQKNTARNTSLVLNAAVFQPAFLTRKLSNHLPVGPGLRFFNRSQLRDSFRFSRNSLPININ